MVQETDSMLAHCLQNTAGDMIAIATKVQKRAYSRMVESSAAETLQAAIGPKGFICRADTLQVCFAVPHPLSESFSLLLFYAQGNYCAPCIVLHSRGTNSHPDCTNHSYTL